MTYIHEQPEWPNFSWDINLIAPALIQARHHQGRILGRMDSLGFSFQEKANLQILTQDVLNTSAIEGEFLNPEAVRSSIARRLGIEFAGMVTPGRDVEGVPSGKKLDRSKKRGNKVWKSIDRVPNLKHPEV